MSEIPELVLALGQTIAWKLEAELRVLARERPLDLEADARRDVQAALEDVGRLAALQIADPARDVGHEVAILQATVANWAWVAAAEARTWVRRVIEALVAVLREAAPVLARALTLIVAGAFA